MWYEDTVYADTGTILYIYHYIYNTAGKITEQYTGLTQPYSENLPNDTYSLTEYTYNADGELIQLTDPIGLSESYTYSAYGLLTSKTDKNGALTLYDYDGLGRVISEVIYESSASTAPSGTREYQYTSTGSLSSVTENSVTTYYQYDFAGRKTHETTGSVISSFVYDLRGNLISASVSSGSGGSHVYSQTYAYYNNGRIRTSQPLLAKLHHTVMNFNPQTASGSPTRPELCPIHLWQIGRMRTVANYNGNGNKRITILLYQRQCKNHQMSEKNNNSLHLWGANRLLRKQSETKFQPIPMTWRQQSFLTGCNPVIKLYWQLILRCAKQTALRNKQCGRQTVYTYDNNGNLLTSAQNNVIHQRIWIWCLYRQISYARVWREAELPTRRTACVRQRQSVMMSVPLYGSAITVYDTGTNLLLWFEPLVLSTGAFYLFTHTRCL